MRRWNRYEATKYAFLGFIGRRPAPTGAGGGIVKRGEIVLKEEMGYVDKFISWIGRHKKLTATGIIGLFGLGLYATNDTMKDKTDKTLKNSYERYFSKSSSKAAGAAPVGIVGVEKINESKPSAAPQAIETPQQNYDYYDKDFKVGIMIEGDAMFKRNVTNMLNTMREVTPNRYAEVIPYAPKKIVRSTHNNNFFGTELIGLHKSTEQLGGADDLKTRLSGIAYLYGEMRGEKADKTGELEKLVINLNRSEANYKVEMFQNEGLVEYMLDENVQVWTQEQADAYLKRISDELKSGEYNKKYN